MNVHELNRDQLTKLKQSYLCETLNFPSYEHLAHVDEYITDEEVFNAYATTEFVEEDFA